MSLQRRIKTANAALALLLLCAGPAAAVWDIETVDATDDVGWYASLALDGSDHPHIAYYDHTNTSLKYAHWNGTAWQVQTVDNGGAYGEFASLALDASGNPHISYRGNGLRYAYWDGASWNLAQLNSTTFYHSTSLVVQMGGQRHIAYSASGTTGGTVYYLYYNGTAWGSQQAVTSTLDPMESNLILDASYRPQIAYAANSGSGGGDVLRVRWNGTGWENDSPPSTALNDGYWPCQKMDSLGYTHISYCELNPSELGDLYYCHWTGSAWVVESPDSDPNTPLGWFSALALDSGDHAFIAYHDHTVWGLKLANNRSGGWTREFVDPATYQYFTIGLDLDSGQNPHLAYYDIGNQNLKYARWAPGAYLLSGTVRDGGGTPFAGAYVLLSGNNITSYALTAADGTWSLSQVPAGDYTLTPVLAGYAFAPLERFLTGLNQNQANQDFTISLATGGAYVRGFVVDPQGYAVEGARLTLSGASVGTYQTAADGYYEFLNLPVGDYTVTPFKNNWTFSPTNLSYTALSVNQDRQDFTGTPVGALSISGYAIDASNQPLANVAVTLSGDQQAVATTAADGYYSFGYLARGDYTLTPSLAGWVFSPSARVYTDLASDQTQQNFLGAVPGSLPLGDDKVKILNSVLRLSRGVNPCATVFVYTSAPGRVVIRIYSVDGVLVRTLFDENLPVGGIFYFPWYAGNQDGQVVGSGVYFVDVKTPAGRYMKKICVVK